MSAVLDPNLEIREGAVIQTLRKVKGGGGSPKNFFHLF